MRSSKIKKTTSPPKLDVDSASKLEKDATNEDNYTEIADSAAKDKQAVTSSNQYTQEASVQNRDNLNASSSVPKASEQDSAVKIEDTKPTPEDPQVAH